MTEKFEWAFAFSRNKCRAIGFGPHRTGKFPDFSS